MVGLTASGRGDAGMFTFFASIIVGTIVYFITGGNKLATTAASIFTEIVKGGALLGAETKNDDESD